MSFLRRHYFWFFLFFPSLSFSKPIVLSYQQCVDYALKYNEQIKAGNADIEISRAQAIETHPGFTPVFKYQYNLAPVPADIDNPEESFFSGDISVFNNFKVEFGSVLTSFGKIKIAQELANLGIESAQLKKKKTTDEVVYNVYQAYTGLLFARSLQSLISKTLSELDERIGKLENEETVDQLEVIRIKMTYNEVKRRAIETKAKEKLALASLKMLMGFDINAPVSIKGGGVYQSTGALKSLNFYISQGEGNNPDFLLLSKGVEAKKKVLQLEKKNRTPSLGVGGFADLGYAPGITGDEDENDFTNPYNFAKFGFGLQLKGDLDLIKTKSKRMVAEADLIKTIYLKNAASNALVLDIQKSYFEVEQARDILHLTQQGVKETKQALFLTKSNLDIGVGEKKDYVEALQNYVVFQAKELEAIFTYNLALAKLKQKSGLLLK